MRKLFAAALILSAGSGPLSAAEPPADAKAPAPYLQIGGAVAARYLWQPSLRREALEYLYHVGVRATAVKRDGYGLALQSYFDSFDTRRYLKGFASTGAGTVAAEPIFNFNRLYLDGYAKYDGRKLNVQFGVLPIDLPTVQLPLSSVQVGGIAGLRADLDWSQEWQFVAQYGNLRTDQTQEAPYKLEGVRERYNWLNARAQRLWSAGRTRAGVYAFDSRLRGFGPGQASIYAEQETPLLDGNLIPRFSGRWISDRDLVTDLVFSLEAKFWSKRASVRPGYIYVERDARAAPLPNSNYFTPGRDRNNLFLYIEAALPRASDTMYAALTTGAKRFMAQQGTRFETGVFLRFAKIL